MPYCQNCGSEVEDGMRFCPGCGTSLLSAEISAAVQPPVSTVKYHQGNESYTLPQGDASREYSLVLISMGTCSKTSTQSLLRDMLGYSVSDARLITNMLPMQIATALNFHQALDLARIFTEYGTQIAVYHFTGYVDFSPYAEASVFNASGSLLQSVLTTLATVTAANKVQNFLKWTIPAAIQNLFRPRYQYVSPPKYEHLSIYARKGPTLPHRSESERITPQHRQTEGHRPKPSDHSPHDSNHSFPGRRK